MSKLGQVVGSIENYNKFVLDQVKRARTDRQFGRELLGRWNDTKAKIPVTRTPTGVPLPRLALPEIDDPGEIARYLFAEGLPGEFPFLNGAYREMYLEPIREVESFEKNGEPPQRSSRQPNADSAQKLFPSCAARFRRTSSKKSRRRTKPFSRSKPRCVFSPTWLSSPRRKCRAGIQFPSAVTTSVKPVRRRCNKLLIPYQTVSLTRKCLLREESLWINSDRVSRSS